MKKQSFSITKEQIQKLLENSAINDSFEFECIKEFNHVYKFIRSNETYFLKIYTKDWYDNDVSHTGGAVQHEVGAIKMLKDNDIPSPDVISYSTDSNNSVKRPFLLTKKLKGSSLTEILADANEQEFNKSLFVAGKHLQKVNSITAPFPGYIMDEKPKHYPGEDKWQHRSWTAKARQKDALNMLEKEKDILPSDLEGKLEKLFLSIESEMREEYITPHYIHGDCHPHQFFLYEENDNFIVSGFIDMEVASFGDKVEDILKFCTEMMYGFSSRNWWNPFIEGYGENPDFKTFKLRMLGMSGEEFFNSNKTHEEILRHLLSSTNFDELFLI
jgi:Ser/Thr protein kinase RdoA (MazF antagonist)